MRKLRKVKVYSPTKKNRETYANEMGKKLGIKIIPVENGEDAVRGSDIVATCTDSIQVVVNDPDLIESGMHLTCVKSNEWSPEIVKKADLVVEWAVPPSISMRARCASAARPPSSPATRKKSNASPIPKVDIFSSDYRCLPILCPAN